MRRHDVSPRAKLLGWIIIVATVAIPVLFAPVQSLHRVRIGLAGEVDPPLTRPVTLTAELPPGYGLSASERRTGWPELNEPHTTEVVLDGPAFEIRMPRASYCVVRLWWGEIPPPPVWLTLRFSDSPDEEYVIWGTEEGADYIVRRADGSPLAKADALWALHLGAYHPGEPDATVPAYLLDVRLERRRGLSPYRASCPRGGPDPRRACQSART